MQTASLAPSPQPLSFAEFTTAKGLSRKMARAFLVHVRTKVGDFNFRSESEWNALFYLFSRTDRRRKG